MKKRQSIYFVGIILLLLLNNFDSINANTLSTGKGNPQAIIKDTLVNIHNFNIIGDSTTDYTAQIQQVLNNHDQVYFPAGTYLISKSLALNDHQVIVGDGLSSVFLAPKDAGTKEAFAFMTIHSKKDISVSQLNTVLQQTPKFAATTLKAVNVAYLSIKKVNAINCGIVETWVDTQYAYKQIPVLNNTKGVDEVSNFFIEVDSCSGLGAQQGIAERTNGVLLYYANHWKVTNSTLKGYNHGIVWWGGDSNPERDGDTVNIRKSKDGLVQNVVVSNIRGGGIWGSMGEDVVVKACNVSYCTDVGIDFEGCYQSKAIDNVVANCVNGGIATFHYNKDILFDSNKVFQDNPGHVLARIYNAAQRQDNGSVTFERNTFTATKGVGLIDQRGPSRHITFVDNTLSNVVLNLSFNNNHYILIKDNTFNITRKAAAYNYVIKAGQTHFGGRLTIEANQINNLAAQDSSLCAISVHQSDYNSSPTNYLRNNVVEGLPKRIRIEWVGANAGTASRTYIVSDTPLPDAAIIRIEKGGKKSELFINDKRQP